MAARAAAALWLILLAGAGASLAQTPGTTPRLELTVDQAVAMALANNRDIEVARVDLASSEEATRAAMGIYDPVVSLSAFRERRTIPVSSILGGSTTGSLHEGETQVLPSVVWLVEPLGSSLTGSLYNDRGATENLFLPLSPQYTTAMTFTYSQPLLRGLKIDAPRRALLISRKNVLLTEAQFRQRVMDSVTQTVQAYWDLAYARQNLAVQDTALTDARRLVDSSRRLVQEGVLAPIDLVETREQVAALETAAFVARDIVNRTQNAFKLLILPNRMAVEWAAEVIPVSSPVLKAPAVNYESAVKTALEKRPEPEQMRQAGDINQIDTKYYRDQLRPQVNLFGTYTSNGLAGTVADRPANPLFGGLAIVPPAELLGGYRQSLSTLLHQDFPTLRVGVQVQLPIRNRTAEANLATSELSGRKLRAQLDQVLQAVEMDVRNAVEGLRLAQGRLDASAEATRFATQQYDSERRRLENGVSTVFLVLQRQSALIGARLREYEAQTNLNKQMAAYDRAVGTTLEENHIDVQAVRK